MQQNNYYDRPLNGLLFWERQPAGEVGLEVEVEGGPWPDGSAKGWVTHEDGSLRNGGIEYVIRNPIARKNINEYIERLRLHLDGCNKVFSFRTSVHVHINVQDLTVRQWVNYVSLFCIFETLLVDVVGAERAGNKFCLRFKDASEPLKQIENGLRKQNVFDFNADYKYASCNLRATLIHGTLEFRVMRGNLDTAFIGDWTRLLLALKDAAINTKDPTVFAEELSYLGAAAFTRKYLPAGNEITEAVLRREHGLHNALYAGVRLMQDLAYSIEWGEPQKQEVPEVPEVRRSPVVRANRVQMNELLALNIWGNPPAAFAPNIVFENIAAEPFAFDEYL